MGRLPLVLLVLCACRRPPPAQPGVAIIDDGELIGRKDGDREVLRGSRNALWAPGRPARLFGLPGETVAFQVVVTAGRAPLLGVTVELLALIGPARLGNAAAPRRFQPIERFVIAELPMARRSGGRAAGESLGWERGAMPPGPAVPGVVPDPLLPVELAPPDADYPMTVAPGEHRAVWIDLTLPEAGLPSGLYRGDVVVRAGAAELARLGVTLEVGPVALPYAAARTLVYYDPQEVRGVTGGGEAVRHYLQLMHRHGLSTFHRVDGPEDAWRQQGELTGALFTAAAGYDGPGAGRPPGVIVLGSYGTLGMPTPASVGRVEAALQALAAAGALAGRPDVVLYAVDEQCDSPAGPAWRAALRERPALRGVLVGHTCSRDPAGQDVDVAIVHAGAYDPVAAAAAGEKSRRVWIYNGSLPQTGSFLSDGGPLSLRANGWIQSRAGIERWLYWESTFWNDDNRGGRGPKDPLAAAETFHNHHGDWANGDGVLVYPGRQGAPGRRSLGLDGVVPSVRLKQWRRGISDAGYLQLARALGPEGAALAEREAAALVGRALRDAGAGPPAWALRGEPFLLARRRLFDLIVRRSR